MHYGTCFLFWTLFGHYSDFGQKDNGLNNILFTFILRLTPTQIFWEKYTSKRC